MLSRIFDCDGLRARFWCLLRGARNAPAGDTPRTRDGILLDQAEPPLGAHLITPRVGFLHHGIYVGGRKVVHCGAVSWFLPRGPVEEVSLSGFCRGRPILVRIDAPASFPAPEVVRRARSRVGENHYRLLTNNCEHFCEWCLHDHARSHQVERLRRRLRLRSGGLREREWAL